ncbi:DUF262 domain-containing protein [Rhizobium lentis]|uniref:DUF262 domain-containing protein n=1 Tax=Rhizobium lentis TaxID=1138194 RepID=A0A9Q3M9M0_9HYPH|nr:DUF262 domain-containing protein [Rhizobium lentis]MBX5023039.1 DUF262 domain-containing protein [Rhizobium lentis]MBX5048101.1 DUF262 domain-containing protein [Rhizobium lentis]MBX5059618.1 DUF262 domain-containing protein [Rhizobium lentis]
MTKEIIIGDVEDSFDEVPPPDTTDPDEFFAKNAFRIIYQTNNFFLTQIHELVTKGEVLNIRPEYQRRLVWSTAQKSRLIESLLLNIPIPPVFFYESSAARYEVMDGQQRLNCIREFIAGDFALTGLQVLKPLNGIRFSRCPPRIKRALERSSVSAIILLLESDTGDAADRLSMRDIRRFIFDRLNTGGKKLNAQEIRNALNPGFFNQAIITISRSRLFTEIFDIPAYIETDPNDYYENPVRQKNALYSSMGDCQLVLRYFALKEDSNIRGSMKSMLDRAMERQMTEAEANQAVNDYLARLSFLYNLFDEEPFQLLPDEKNRVRVSAAIYDASMVAIDKLWHSRAGIEHNKPVVLQRMQTALSSPDDLITLTGQGNTAQAVRDRINLMERVFTPA